VPAERSGPRPFARVFPTPRWAVPLLFAVLLAAFAAGIWGTYRDTFPGKGLYRVTGVFENRVDRTMILVKHDVVPGLMPEMTSMAFFAESGELLDRAALQPGDRVRLTVRRLSDDKLVVIEIRKLR
jgi:copper binding protein CusF